MRWRILKQQQADRLYKEGKEEAALKWEQCNMLDGLLDDDLNPLVTREQLVDLLETPQGIEMVTKYGLVDRRLMEVLAGHNRPRYGLFIRGFYKMLDPQTCNGVIIASHYCTGLTVRLTHALHPSPVIVALHGALVHVEAFGNSVCRVAKDEKSHITMSAMDEATILADESIQ
jgi:hypothetical protein